ncbi:MAG: permease [bacterium]
MAKRKDCQLHSKSRKTVNRTLISLILFGLGLIFLHVWIHNRQSFLPSLGQELWALLMGRTGIIMELKEVFIYFLVGILIAGYIRTYKLHIRLRKVLIKYGFISIFLAAFIGVFSPLCSCGILTTVVALLAAGLPLAPAMALLISSPLMSPTAFFLTLNDLGLQWTMVRVLVAFLMGVLAGVITHLLSKKGFESSGLFWEGGVPAGDFHDPDYPDERLRCTCNEKFSNKIARKTKNKFIIFLAKSTEMSWLIGKYVVVGIAVGCIIERYVPHSYIYKLFGEGGALSAVWVTLGSIPIFLHQISASSILYHIKISLPGIMDSRAALAFLIGGPVTAIPAMILLWSMFKKRVFVLYMSISILGTLFFAYTMGNWLFVPHVDVSCPLLSNVSALEGGKSAVISKSNNVIRTAVAPEGRPIVAYYEDEENGNRIVFDACLNRFQNKSLSETGNRRYAKNVANWLKETPSPPNNNRILIYNTYEDQGLDNSFFQELLSVLAETGKYEVDIFDRRALPLITLSILQQYGQLWIFPGQVGTRSFSNQEIQDIGLFCIEGNSLLTVAGPHDSHEDWTASMNQITEDFGVRFSGAATFQKPIPVSVLTYVSGGISRGMLRFFGWMGWLR